MSRSSAGWSEDSIHRWLARGPRPRGLGGSPGHDAAVLRRLAREPVVCADQCIEGVHFLPGARAREIGRKAACRALSDLAATAARPRALLCTLAAPRGRSEAWLRGVLAGVREAGRQYGADLVGGDLASTRGPVVIGVSALGELALPTRPPGRDRARVGQRIVVTGPLGGSALGRHLRIRPRIEAGIALARAGATSLMDVSDGLAWDLYRMARASGVGFELELERVPLHRDARRLARRSGRTALDHALHDGEDHELVATLDARARTRARAAGIELVELGRVVRGSGLVLLAPAGQRTRWRPEQGGWKHGS